MKQSKKPNRIHPRKVTRLKEEPKILKENEKALKLIRSFKGMFG